MNEAAKKYLPLIISTAAASFMVNLDTYIINVSIPAIAADFLVDKADVSWVVMSYNLLVVSLLLICGKLADKIGLKKLFTFGFVVFTISSLLCAFSQNLGQLIVSRIIQGIGASVLYALPQAIIGKFLPKEQRGMGFGMSASAAALGIMLGSPLSGLITGLLSWHWIFLINIPVGVAIILLITKNADLFQEQNPVADKKFDFDITGSILSFFAILGLCFWLNRLNSLGFNNPFMAGIFAVSVILTLWFIVHCLKSDNPLVDLSLFKNKYFTAGNFAMFLISAFLAGNNFIMPFYLAEIKHFSEVQTGSLFVIYSASYMTFSLIYGKISKKIQATKVSSLAGVLSTLSVLLFMLNIKQDGFAYIIGFFILLGISFSFFITSNNNFIMAQAKENNAGAVAGLHRMTGRFGMLFGVVIFEFIFSFTNNIHLNGYLYTYAAGLLICLTSGILSMFCISDKTV
ncbi:MAG: MFS transporter [Candidatus Gastranaerophilales bacterium]|nr:MFS transporter [Candidatus Gastranaerophilales bacterium]